MSILQKKNCCCDVQSPPCFEGNCFNCPVNLMAFWEAHLQINCTTGLKEFTVSCSAPFVRNQAFGCSYSQSAPASVSVSGPCSPLPGSFGIQAFSCCPNTANQCVPCGPPVNTTPYWTNFITAGVNNSSISECGCGISTGYGGIPCWKATTTPNCLATGAWNVCQPNPIGGLSGTLTLTVLASVQSSQDFRLLSPGDMFIDPDGAWRKKPRSPTEHWSTCRQIDRKAIKPSGDDRGAPCIHRGEQIDEVPCETCSGNVRLKVFQCAVKGQCTIGRQSPGMACCASCEQYQSSAGPNA